jgi:hypothetical protein
VEAGLAIAVGLLVLIRPRPSSWVAALLVSVSALVRLAVAGTYEEGDRERTFPPPDTGQLDRPEDRGAGGAPLPGCQARMGVVAVPCAVAGNRPFVLDSRHGTRASFPGEARPTDRSSLSVAGLSVNV